MYQTDQELSLRNAVVADKAGKAAIAQGCTDFDLSRLSVVDSVAVAVMLGWQRTAKNAGKSLKFHGIPASLISLIDLYGVSGLLNTVAARHP
jgi:phospholipid transport system transporter-binding protein